ncbi:MAG: Gfo/Idh/MocA family oxidoreductase [Candidatus Acidiferrales bacterium]
MLSAAIIGAGRIGKIRADVVQRNGGRVVAVADVDLARARKLVRSAAAKATTDWAGAVSLPEVDAVIVCTPTKFHVDAVIASLRAGKHVLCEKPLGRTVEEALRMVVAGREAGRVFKVGFNYRHMAHVRKTKELLNANSIGPLHFLRARYGHGGRPGYDKEWCTDADLSGGGVLLEQGIHILDLARYLFGEPAGVYAETQRFFWDFPVVEDNAFCLMKFASCQTAQVHVSWTQWANLFEMELFGRDGFLRLEGRDGHYGPQRLTWAKRRSDHRRPEEQVFEFPSPDDSWDLEWREFVSAIDSNREPIGSAEDGLRAQQMIECAYQSAVERFWIAVPENLEIQKEMPR